MDPTAVVAIVLIVATGGWFMYRSETKAKRPRKKREAALRVVADRMGFTYSPEGDPLRQEPFLEPQITTASRRLNKAFYGYPHVLRGQCDEGPVTIFDVWHGGGSGNGRPDASKPYKVTMAAFRFPDLDLPPLTISPERKSDRFSDVVFKPIRAVAGWSDIDFDEHPAFSERYSLRSGDESRARALFSPSLVAFWESLPAEHRLSAEAVKGSLVVFREPKSKSEREGALPPVEYETFLREAASVAAAFRAAAGATPRGR